MGKLGCDYVVKLLMIGDSGVGKTSISSRFVDNAFDDVYSGTIGIDFKVKTIEIDNKKIKLQIWDTSGQERFRTILSSYYRGSHGILVVYDCTDQRSFDHVAEWLSNIETYASSGTHKILIANKCDMDDKRVISTKMGNELAKRYNIKFLEVSAKNNVGIRDAIYALSKDAIETIGVTHQLYEYRTLMMQDIFKQEQPGGCCVIN